MKYVIVPLAVCLLSSIAATQGPPPVSEVLPLPHLTGPDPLRAPPPWGSLLTNDHGSIDLLAQMENDGFTADDAINLLRTLESDAFENSQLQAHGLGDTLLVAGDPAAVARVREHAKTAAQLLARPLQVEFAAWDGADRETPAALLGPNEYSRFASGRTPLWRTVATTRHGRAVSLERMRWSSYVRDIDVHVAQKQVASFPRTGHYGEGGHAVVRPHLLTASDDVVLHVQFAAAQRRGVVRTLTTGMTGAADLELPTLETVFGACSGRVPNGGALAVALRGNAVAGGQVVLTVRVLARTPPAGAAFPNVGIYPCGALTNLALTKRVVRNPDDGREYDDREPTAGFGTLTEDMFEHLVQAALGAEGEGEGVSIRYHHGYLIARAPTHLQSRIEALVRGLQDRLLRNATVVQKAPMATVDPDGATGAAMLHDLSAPTLLGRELTIARWLETNVVDHIGASVAQEAATLDPGVDLLQCGCLLSARVTPAGDGMHARVLVEDLYAPPPQARSVMPGGGVLMPAEVATSRVDHDGVVVNGQAIEHGDGPAVHVEGRAWRSTLATTIVW